MKNKFIKKQSGYTIIETMIAISLFLTIVTIGMGSLLNANLLHQKSQDMRSIMDNLSFIIEDMGRNLRTGYHYRCYKPNTWNDSFKQTAELNTPQDCESGGVIVFEEGHGDPANNGDQWAYKIESTRTASDGISIFDIEKSIDGGASWVQINPDEVELSSVSGFAVSGSLPPSDPFSSTEQQPFVTIRLVGRILFKGVETPFSLQTSVSQRNIDI